MNCSAIYPRHATASHLLLLVCASVLLYSAEFSALRAQTSSSASAANTDLLNPAGAGVGGNVITAATAVSGKFAILYVESARKWKFGLRSEPYDKISQYIEDVFVRGAGQRGLAKVDSADHPARKVVVELLEVNIHPAMFKKPGMDISATLSVVDGVGRQLYSKGYRGESRTMINTYGHLIDHAAEDLVEKAMGDRELINALGGSDFKVAR